MVKVTRAQLWHFLSLGGKDTDYAGYKSEAEFSFEDEPYAAPIDESTFAALQAADLVDIVSDQNADENPLGGDDLVNVADNVLRAVKDGYHVITWYGDETECLVAGVRPGEIEVVEG